MASLSSLSPEVISDPTFQVILIKLQEVKINQSMHQASPSSSSLGSSSRSASISAGSDREASSSSGQANPGASYEEALASQVLTEFPELSGLLEQIMDEESN